MRQDGSFQALQKSEVHPSDSIFEHSIDGRPTVVMVITHHDAVLLVRNAKGGNWMLPQGGIVEGDTTLLLAALREGFEEVALTEQYLVASRQQRVLGECVHYARGKRGKLDAKIKKHLFFIALPVWSRQWTRLNSSENMEYRWVESHEELVTLLHDMRDGAPTKYAATCEAITHVIEMNYLEWQSQPVPVAA